MEEEKFEAFMKQIKEQLSKLSPDEREKALISIRKQATEELKRRQVEIN